jgi:CubicO group peptidase (beta-lactamase class C family)
MTSSGFDFAHLSDPDKATGYKRMGSDPLPATIVDSTASGGAGALYSTVEDLYKWDRALYTSAVLRPADLQQAFTNHMNHYGLGWSVDSLFDRPTVSHSGGIFGFTSYILRFPTEETVIILLDNSGSPSLPEMGRSFAALVFGQSYQLPRLIAR